MAADITKTGPLNYRQLQTQNQQTFNPETATTEDWYKHLTSRKVNDYNDQPTEYVGLQAAQAGYGESQYDEGLTSASQFSDLGDIRYENQPWYDTLANGIGKMLGTAGTTFVSSLVGLPYGLFEAANQGRWSALWDNDVTQGLAEVDKWLEDNMTNYRSQVQQNSPWYDPENLTSMNFIADDVIKNMGFTLGAAASMAVGSGSLGLMSRALGFVNNVSKGTKMGSAALSALFSATGEGMIEARQGVEERNKLEMQRLDDALLPEKQALEMEFQEIEQEYTANRGRNMAMGPDGTMYDPAYEEYKLRMEDLAQRRDALTQKYEAGRQQILESGQEMGNTILLANQGLLTLGNLIQFGKGMVKGFDKARHAAEVSTKTAKPFGVAAERVSNSIKDGYKVTGKGLGRTVAATKGLFTEGSEEMNQQMIQSSAGAKYNEADINDYWKARLDPESYRETTKGLYTMGQILDRGFNESWGDVNQWEQFVIGGITGLAGSYTPTKLFNQDKQYGAWDPRRYGSWEGGAVNELRDFNREYNQYQENIDDLNKILQSEDFPARVRSMVGHTYTEQEKTEAAEADDKKAFKDAEDKQFVHDIQAFLRAGKLDDLRAIYNKIGSEVSDDDIQNIIKSTTKEITAEEDKKNFDRQVDEQIAAHQRRITELQDQAQSIGDNQEALGIDERADYQAAVTPALENIFKQIDDEYDAIDNLNQQKQNYVPQKYYEGAYVDRQGNQTSTNEEIRETVKHNSEELNRKLDSYLDSIDYINRRTNGQLTKDQEDNLAYLHHMGKESDVRMRKIMANVRKQLPSKFLLKTSKSPEELTKENASSDLVFSRDENTKEGYVEVDTSAMNDAAFADFFQREVMRGGNIRPEFGETADEKAAREQEESNLPDEEKKAKARERASKKWNSAIQKMQDDANEQWDINWRNLVDNFMDNYRKDNNATLDETIEAFSQVRQDLQDASDLFDQAGEYQRTLIEYMQNPNKVDEDKAKEETKAQKAESEQQAKNKFEGKDAKQMKQELAAGTLDFDDFNDFADMDLSGDAPEPMKTAQDEAKKAKEGMQKTSALKNHIQEQLGDNPTEAELKAAQIAMQMVDEASLAADDPSEINIDMPELNQVPLDQVDPNASIDDVEYLSTQVQGMLSEAFNALNEDESAQEDIPETVPTGALDDVEPPTTGHDETVKSKPEVKSPQTPSPANQNGPVDISSSSTSNAAPQVLPKNPLTEGAIDNIIIETSKSTSPNTTGTWRSTTTRHPYGKSTGTYHETLPDKNSVQYKRSKAIWEYLNVQGAFDRQENASADRVKAGDTIHFMVKYMPEVFGARLEEVSDENKPYAMVVIMLNDNGEVIGDLPLAELEPSFRGGNPTQQVKDLKAFQDKVFKAFFDNFAKIGANQAIVDSGIQREDADNLNLTFNNAKKSPLVSKVKQVMRGVVPYRKSEKNTLNEVTQGNPELAVKVTGTNVATKRGDKTQHKEIVIPDVGTTGQPYLLLPTASGEKIAVPFYMPAFDAENHRETELYKQLSNALFYMLTTTGTSKDELVNFGKHLDVVEGLLQVKRQDGAKKIVDINLNNHTVTLHLQSLTNPEQKIDRTIPYSESFKDMARALADSLSGIPINVSLQFLNDNIQTGMGSGMVRRVSYNMVIGEIADVNLPKATQHTVNSWFTVELTTQAGTKPSKKVTPKTTGTISDFVGGRIVEIDLDQLIAYDPKTGEVITGDEDVNLRLAQIKSKKSMYQDKDKIQITIDGELRTYNIKENKFEKNPSKPASSRRDFVKEIAAAKTVQDLVALNKAISAAQANGEISAEDLIKLTGYVNQKHSAIASETPDVSEVSAPKSGAVSFETKPATPQVNSVIEITVPTMTGETRTEKVQKVKASELKKGDIVWYSGPESEIPIGQDTIFTVENGEVWGERGLIKSKAIYKVAQITPLGKSLDKIEQEMKDKKVIGRQNKDAWAAIPGMFKQALVNDGAYLQLSYNNKSVVISLSNMPEFIKALSDANMAAKAGSLQVREAAKPMEQDGIAITKENERAARRWLAKNLPSLSSEERTQFVDTISRLGDNAGKAWGSYRAGVIEIRRNAPMGTVYHEAFHYVLDMVLSPEERAEILNIAKEEYGLSDNYAAEERLANDFRRYAMDENTTGIVGRIKRWLRKINDKIHRYNRISDTTVNQLFWKINNGELASKSDAVESFEETQQRVLREIRNVQKEKNSWKSLSSASKDALKNTGLSEETYNEMSLEEKEQYIKCRS